jgi:Transposase DDE domain group 1
LATQTGLGCRPHQFAHLETSASQSKGLGEWKKNVYCRHVLRFTLAGYHENLLSLAYPGNRHGYEYFKPALKYLLTQWACTPEQVRQIILRSDAEQGTDQNVSYVLWCGMQVLMKGYSGKRTQTGVHQTAAEAWQADPTRTGRWAVATPTQLRLGRQLQSYLLRWLTPRNELKHASLLSTLPYPLFMLWNLYDGRGADEVEIRSDKSGLDLTHRRKHRLNAQEGWLILTDTAHNLLAWLHPWMLNGSPFEGFGPKRIVQDLMSIPGQVIFKEDHLEKVALLKTHPYAAEMRACLQKMLHTFDLE